MDLTAFFRELAAWAGPSAVAALWQGAALAPAIALCLRLTPRIAAADRFKVWAAGFATVVLLPFLPVVALVLPLSPTAGPVAGGPAAAAHPWLQIDARWSLAIAALWLAVSFYRLVNLGIHSLRLRKLWKSAAPIAPDELPASLQANLHDARRPVEVCATHELDRPAAIGFFRPRILVPDWLLERMTPGELEQVVLHETEHLRRRDDWTNLAQKLALAAFPLNPALLWMERRLCREREMACDEGVVRRTQAPRAYAACLASLAERGLERVIERRIAALSLGAWQRRPELADRVHRILRRAPGLSPAMAKALVAAVVCGLAAGSVEFARCPQLVAFVSPWPVQPELASAAAHANSPESKPLATESRREKQPQILRLRSAKSRPSFAQDDNLKSPATVQTASAEGTDALIRSHSSRENRNTQSVFRQWVVLAAWEQVETSANQVDAAGDTAVRPDARQFTITRQIVLIAPAGESNPAAKDANLHSTSTPAQPAAIPLSNNRALNWLVLQL